MGKQKPLAEYLQSVQGQRELEQAAKTRPNHPKGFEPGVAFDHATNKGFVCGQTTDATPNFEELLVKWGWDPEEYEIDGDTVQVRTWDSFAKVKDEDGVESIQLVQLWYHRASIRRKHPDYPDVPGLLEDIRRYKAPKRPAPTGDLAFVANLADLQWGKGEGDGVTGTLERVQNGIEAVRARYRELRKIGRSLGTLYIVDIGDPVEGCGDNHYPGQNFQIQLNRRDQEKLARRVWVDCIRRWAPDFEQVVVLAVPSNHGENRQNGKRLTDDGDDAGLGIMEAVAEQVRENQALDHVSFVIPRDEMVVTLDVAGEGEDVCTVSWTHSHKAERSGGSFPQAKVKRWWSDQSFSKKPGVRDAHVLTTGHFHHLTVTDWGGGVHIQCTTQDPGSKWFEDVRGVYSTTGFTTYVCGPRGSLPGGLVEGRLSDIQVV